MPEAGEVGVGATAASGILLGVAVCLVELVEEPLSYANPGSLSAFLAGLAPVWCALGLGWAFAARWAEPRFSLPGLSAVWVVAAIVLTGAINPFDGNAPLHDKPFILPNEARLFHVLWMNLFYGGIYLTGYVVSRRAVTSRRMLARVQQAREESAALLAETRLETMRRQLQPQTILDALSALRRLYPNDPAGADDLVDVLVGFLRPAVRSLAGGGATLAGELSLVGRYLSLRAAVTGVEKLEGANGVPPACEFPPRLLMPLIEGLCLSGARPTVEGVWRGDDYHIVLAAEGVRSDALDERLRRRIAAAEGQWAHAFKSAFVFDGDRLCWKLTVPRTRRTETMERDS